MQKVKNWISVKTCVQEKLSCWVGKQMKKTHTESDIGAAQSEIVFYDTSTRKSVIGLNLTNIAFLASQSTINFPSYIL